MYDLRILPGGTAQAAVHESPGTDTLKMGNAGAWWAFACSHGGEAACVDGAAGLPVWRARLPGRCDLGLAVTHDLRCGWQSTDCNPVISPANGTDAD